MRIFRARRQLKLCGERRFRDIAEQNPMKYEENAADAADRSVRKWIGLLSAAAAFKCGYRSRILSAKTLWNRAGEASNFGAANRMLQQWAANMDTFFDESFFTVWLHICQLWLDNGDAEKKIAAVRSHWHSFINRWWENMSSRTSGTKRERCSNVDLPIPHRRKTFTCWDKFELHNLA